MQYILSAVVEKKEEEEKYDSNFPTHRPQYLHIHRQVCGGGLRAKMHCIAVKSSFQGRHVSYYLPQLFILLK
jgi:hypothetical protein